MLEIDLKGVEKFIQEVSWDIASNIETNTEAVVDYDTADFEVSGKQIKLVGVNLEEWYIRDIVEDVLKSYFKDHLQDQD